MQLTRHVLYPINMHGGSDLFRLAEALGGLPVLGCLQGSPAAEAGIRYGDILLAVDGTPTSSWDDFIQARQKSNGRFLARIFRDGAELELNIDLRPSTATPIEILGELLSRRILGGIPDDSTAH